MIMIIMFEFDEGEHYSCLLSAHCLLQITFRNLTASSLLFSSRRSSRIEPREMRERAKNGVSSLLLPSPLSLFFCPRPTFRAVSHLSRFDSRRSPRGKEETTRSLFRNHYVATDFEKKSNGRISINVKIREVK